MAETPKPTRIEVDYQDSAPERIKLTRRQRLARTAAGTLLAFGALGHGIAEEPGNPVGHLVGDAINTGVAVVDLIPGVDSKDLPSPDEVGDQVDINSDLIDGQIDDPENLEKMVPDDHGNGAFESELLQHQGEQQPLPDKLESE